MSIRRIPGHLLPLTALLLANCYSAEFTQTSPYALHERAKETVQVMTTRPDGAAFKEVGIISASGAGFPGALERAKEEAARHGCDSLVVLSEGVESGAGVPGSAYGMTRNHLRCSCLVQAAADAATAK